MLRGLRSAMLGISIGISLAAVPVVLAQAPSETPAAPVPPQISSARKIFIANAGSESTYRMEQHNWYAGGPNRSYNQFYAAMKSWGQVELVSSPADADLVYEIRFADKVVGGSLALPQFRLLIVDPKTHTLLWAVTKSVEPAGWPKNREKNYEIAMNALVDEVKALASPAAVVQK